MGPKEDLNGERSALADLIGGHADVGFGGGEAGSRSRSLLHLPGVLSFCQALFKLMTYLVAFTTSLCGRFY